MKIKIKRANTNNPFVETSGGLISFIFSARLNSNDRWNRYWQELVQQNKWNAEKCQRAQCAIGE